VPLFEPADSQEAYAMTLAAFELSEKYQVPVILRMTTRICHVKALVTVGERRNTGAGFKKDPSRFVMVPGNAGKRIPLMFQRDNTLRAEAEQSAWNVIEPGSDKRVGFVTSGPAYMHVKESFPMRRCSSSASRGRCPSRSAANWRPWPIRWWWSKKSSRWSKPN
jgi:indolepyruvate ferredoxin oxidoreductase alpha subunit